MFADDRKMFVQRSVAEVDPRWIKLIFDVRNDRDAMTGKRSLDAETKFRLLEQISHEIRGTLDVDETLEHLLDVVGSVLTYDAAGIFVLNQGQFYPRHGPAGSMIAGIAMRGFDDRPVFGDAMLMEGKGIVGHVIRTGRSVVTPDIRLDPHYVEGRARTRSEIAVPVLQQDKTIGALNLESDRPGAYDESDLETLRFFAEAAAISIAKAMLHQQLLVKERIEEQLRLAQTVQTRLLPSAAPRVRGFDVAGICIPAYDVGGDYYDWFELPGDALGVVMADVSGKGVPAALIMSAFRALLRVLARGDAPLADLMSALNRHLRESTGPASFVTAVYGVLDPQTGRFEYANCGHFYPLLLRADGALEMLESGGTMLGILEDVEFRASEVVLEPGDCLVLYTDGVVECERRGGGAFGGERLEALVREAAHLPAAGMVERILAGTRTFCGADNFDDDYTLAVIKRPA